VPALRTQNATRPKRSVGRADRCAYAWNGRSGETETAGAATREVKVCDPRNPRYSVARRLAAGEFIAASLKSAQAVKKSRWFAEGSMHEVVEFNSDFRIGGAE